MVSISSGAIIGLIILTLAIVGAFYLTYIIVSKVEAWRKRE